ncbi:trypsin-like peptidase domain-containing protein [Dokdonella ginsengisoli]|uniref:Trypsin-like peptidase domain-containing protein n=1 Tax=Dokdonella ginsengisoli TaxID=363846 RepID=A0ABV9QY57_9GAMM
MIHRCRRLFVAALVTLASPVVALAAGGVLPTGPAACPAAPPPRLASLASTTTTLSPDALAIDGAASPPGAAEEEAVTQARERAAFDRILGERSAVAVPAAPVLALSPQQKAEIEGDMQHETRPKVGTALALDQVVEFSAVDISRLPSGGLASQGGIVGRTDQGILVWETALASDGARALRVEFTGLALAAGVDLYVYNEDGQVWGPFTRGGPDGSGAFWSPSVFGDTLRVHLRAQTPAALAASRFTIARVMHLGARVGPLQDRIRERYAVGPSPSDTGFCGVQVPDCAQNAVCWIDTNAGLAGPSNAIAHLQFVEGGSSYICTGAYLAQSGGTPQQPYFMTANHCFSTQASASSLEAFFKYRTSACNGTCPTLGSLPRVNGATLIATGATSDSTDFTFLRLSGFPAGGATLLGWTADPFPEGASVMHMGHPAGSPLVFSYRRARFGSNSGLPHASDLPEPRFLYSGLASSSEDWAGATAGGSSGGPALLLLNDGSVRFVGQLTGAAYSPPGPPNPCDPNGVATVDGAFSRTYPRVSRYLYDRVFTSGFEGQ